MEQKIVITDDLAEMFIALSQYEGYCTDITPFPALFNAEGSLTLSRLKREGKNLPELFSLLSHLLLLYEGIDIPLLNGSYRLCGEMTSVAHITNTGHSWYSEGRFPELFSKDVLSNELALALKPLVINYCMNEIRENSLYSVLITNLAAKTTGSVNSLFSYVYDRYYNNNLQKNEYIDTLLDSLLINDKNNLFIEYESDLATIYDVFRFIHKSILYLLLIHKKAQDGLYDFYTPAFSDYYTTTNADDAYCIVKTQISKIMELQPAFKSLTEILIFRDRKHREIKLLRNEVSTLEALLIQGEKEQAIQKAINDVRSANQSLIKDTPVKKIAKIATYVSVPISLLELYKFKTSYSIAIGAVGTAAQFITDYSDSKNNWLFVAR